MSRSGQYKWSTDGQSMWVMARIDASRNQGNSANGTKSSSSASRIQKPWAETFVTSAAEVSCPRRKDFIVMSLDKGAHCAKLPIIQGQILCQFYLKNGRPDPAGVKNGRPDPAGDLPSGFAGATRCARTYATALFGGRQKQPSRRDLAVQPAAGGLCGK